MRQPSRGVRAVVLVAASVAALPASLVAQSGALEVTTVAALSLDPVGPSRGLPPAPDGQPIRSTARLGSGFVPTVCAELQAHDSARLVDCWLGQFPRIAETIRWEFVQPDGRTRIASWPEWDDASRQAVRDAFVHARMWWSGGLRSWPGVPFQDPPENLEQPFLGDQRLVTVLDGPTAAWPLYTAQIGLSLAAEIGRWVPWSLRSYDREALQDLFDAPRNMFVYDTNDGGPDDTVALGYSPRGAVTPPHPTTSFRFLFENRLPAGTPVDTIANVLEWSRRHVQRDWPLTDPLVGDELPIPHGVAFWQYAGKAPVARILAGTRVADPRAREPWSWTHGCAMTSDTLAWLLRAVNIPVRRLDMRGSCPHSTAFFSGENVYLSHGDDPYDVLSSTGSFSARLLLVSARLWQTWFPAGDGEPWCWNVGRRVIDLNFTFPSDYLVGVHCTDVLSGASHDESEVRKAFRNLYTQEQLEGSGLWQRLSERAETSTAPACVAVRAKR
jgi:hypothetical protein